MPTTVFWVISCGIRPNLSWQQVLFRSRTRWWHEGPSLQGFWKGHRCEVVPLSVETSLAYKVSSSPGSASEWVSMLGGVREGTDSFTLQVNDLLYGNRNVWASLICIFCDLRGSRVNTSHLKVWRFTIHSQITPQVHTRLDPTEHMATPSSHIY